MTQSSTPVGELVNIGPVVAKELDGVGIKTYSDLENVGSAKALKMIRMSSAKGCYNMLYALEGAIQGLRWHDLSKEEKERVKNELKNLF